MTKFYVYSYSTKKDGIFYIGKGIKNRIYATHKNCPLCYNILKARKKQKIKIIKRKIFKNLTEKEAFAWETSLIWFYNPRGNLTLGGEGVSGHRHSRETRIKMSLSRKNISKETRKNISLAQKGRCAGNKNPMAVLSKQQVFEIREKYIPRKYTRIHLAKEYNVSKGTIQAIIENRSWANKEWEEKLRKMKEEKNHFNLELTKQQENEIIKEYNSKKYSQRKLAKMYFVSRGVISGIIKREAKRCQAKIIQETDQTLDLSCIAPKQMSQ